MLTGIHFLLTYTCTYECDHCFLYCSPRAEGTFTVAQIRNVLDEAKMIGTIESVFYEGGEPFLYFPVLEEGLKLARQNGFRTGIVTNCYWATAEEDAAMWLGPLARAGVHDLSFSDDSFHCDDENDRPAQRAAAAATGLGLPSTSICIDKPVVAPAQDGKGQPVVGGGALFKGRAVEKLAPGMPTQPASSFNECKHEELVDPERVHVDAFGNVMVCQGISIGNMWNKPLSAIIADYDASAHPVCGPLARGGPVELARVCGMQTEGEFVDECHYCFMIRRGLLGKYPGTLTPRQVYGIEPQNG